MHAMNLHSIQNEKSTKFFALTAFDKPIHTSLQKEFKCCLIPKIYGFEVFQC